MSTYDDTPTLPARLFVLQAEILGQARVLHEHSTQTACFIALSMGSDRDALTYLRRAEAFVANLHRMHRELVAIRRDLNRPSESSVLHLR